jgi:hypothetical protein
MPAAHIHSTSSTAQIAWLLRGISLASRSTTPTASWQRRPATESVSSFRSGLLPKPDTDGSSVGVWSIVLGLG